MGAGPANKTSLMRNEAMMDPELNSGPRHGRRNKATVVATFIRKLERLAAVIIPNNEGWLVTGKLVTETHLFKKMILIMVG